MMDMTLTTAYDPYDPTYDTYDPYDTYDTYDPYSTTRTTHTVRTLLVYVYVVQLYGSDGSKPYIYIHITLLYILSRDNLLDKRTLSHSSRLLCRTKASVVPEILAGVEIIAPIPTARVREEPTYTVQDARWKANALASPKRIRPLPPNYSLVALVAC